MRRSCLALLSCIVLQAQTPTESALMKTALHDIRQRVANTINLLQTPIKAPNWRGLVNTDMVTVTADAALVRQVSLNSVINSISVPAGADLQAALDLAQPGDFILLEPGAVYRGNFILPFKTGTSHVTIMSSNMTQLPSDSERVKPVHAPLMPKIVSPNTLPALKTVPSAHHYKIIGIEITVDPGIYSAALVQLGTGTETNDASLPHTIELDRVYIHGDPVNGGKRGVALNGKGLVVKNSHISDIQSSTQETQALCAWNTPGPLQIVNNRLEAAGMAILIGGADPAYVGITPTDILITQNYMTRPLAWRSTNVDVKNVLQLSAGRRVLITKNILENVWTSAQVGYAINLKVGETKYTPAITTEVTITDNIIRSAAGGININGMNSSGGVLSNITIRNNLFDNIGPAWGTALGLFGINGGANGITIENNTASPTVKNSFYLFADRAPSASLVFRSNVFPHSSGGMKGSGEGSGLPTLNRYFPGAIFTNNVLYGSTVAAGVYPVGNFFPTSSALVGWVDITSGIWKLAPASTYKAPVGAQDPGVDYDSLILATNSTILGK